MSEICCCCDNAVAHARDILPSQNTIDIVSNVFKLFGDPTRAGILCALSRHYLCVSELASVLNMSSSAISHQLRLLKQTGMIQASREGKNVIYSIADTRIENIFNLALQYSEESEK